MNVGEHRVELTLEHHGTFACSPDTVDLYANDFVQAAYIVEETYEGTDSAERAASTVAELPWLVVCAWAAMLCEWSSDVYPTDRHRDASSPPLPGR